MCCYCEKNEIDTTKPLIRISEVVEADVFIKDDMLWLLCRDIETGIYERKYIHIKKCPLCGRDLCPYTEEDKKNIIRKYRGDE